MKLDEKSSDSQGFGVDILIQRGGKAIRTKMILLFNEDSLKQEILGLFIHNILIQISN
jgi:hypothetical protein